MGLTLMDISTLTGLLVDGEFVSWSTDYPEDVFDINFDSNSMSSFIQNNIGSNGDPVSDSEHIHHMPLPSDAETLQESGPTYGSGSTAAAITIKSIDKDTVPVLSTQKFVNQDTKPPFNVPSPEAGDLNFDDITFDLDNILNSSSSSQGFSFAIPSLQSFMASHSSLNSSNTPTVTAASPSSTTISVTTTINVFVTTSTAGTTMASASISTTKAAVIAPGGTSATPASSSQEGDDDVHVASPPPLVTSMSQFYNDDGILRASNPDVETTDLWRS
ncbi:putative protein TPRXL [Arachis ipaensis]|uniref:putative protein TPRXL n=1 Tax=Arachis ipaensis TaxID=130454 RepID=UPI0007AF84BB|nr:putative protein TPRXL [Arachis ipaensis]XP_025685655.1 putative protein TPRXL [Arachis hypogaea]